ncbi:hypothetical protein ACS016_09900 [Aeromonas veronii]|uniref:hypothetical protein n=1 Tax=Aeromonas veronii TaxID=654 RepID=UPI003F7C6C3D
MMFDFDNKLKKFFTEPSNSSRRESLLLNRMSYDLQLAAATSGYYLKVYNSDVDDNGYDVIIDSEMVTKKLQIKSLLTTSKTRSWKINKGLIKPDVDEVTLLIDWTNIHPPGIGGGVILQEVQLNELDINIQYYYSDIWIITLYSKGIIGDLRQQKVARKLISQLIDGNHHDKINITKSLFLKVKSPSCLLSLMCIHSNYVTSKIRYLLSDRLSGLIAPPEQIDILINEEIERLCHHK